MFAGWICKKMLPHLLTSKLHFSGFYVTRYLHAKKFSTKYLDFENMFHYLLTHEYLKSKGLQITCCSMTTRAMAAWTTLVRSRQSMQLTRKIPSCLHITPAWSTLVKRSMGLIYNFKKVFKKLNSTLNTMATAALPGNCVGTSLNVRQHGGLHTLSCRLQ
jgi:hypothetical protein